jgi:ElaB/YqjD/DUF883 family membrane-anchored ribosome-binding protein
MDSYEGAMDQTTEEGRRARDTAREVADRASSWMQATVSRASDRAQGLAREAGDRMSRVTESMDSWSVQARRFVRERPLQSIALAIGVGYVLGKALKRG